LFLSAGHGAGTGTGTGSGSGVVPVGISPERLSIVIVPPALPLPR
jgi:hypothetical protein